MPTQHRVSFGSKGSMVETWIIYDDNKDSQSLPESDTAEQQTPRFVSSNSSLESRDNPFVPGGELSIDTDDILKRATIVRDRFILDEEAKKKKAAAEEEEERKRRRRLAAAAPGGDASLTATTVEGVQENGKVEGGDEGGEGGVALEAESAKTTESEAAEGANSPQASVGGDAGRVESGASVPPDAPAGEGADAAAHKEKKKQKKKCCTIM